MLFSGRVKVTSFIALRRGEREKRFYAKTWQSANGE